MCWIDPSREGRGGAIDLMELVVDKVKEEEEEEICAEDE